MADATRTRGSISQPTEDLVVRQFSGVRIEQLLLTRLFDLATGLQRPEESPEPSRPLLNHQHAHEARGQPQEVTR